MGSSITAKVMRGCPQGGVLSPLLWNLVVDRLLTATNDLGFSTFGYADDIVIIVQGKFTHNQGIYAKCPECGSEVGCRRGS
jgi:retron-type reverse transcriptase